MTRNVFRIPVITCLLIGLVIARPNQDPPSSERVKNIVGTATQILTSNVLQGSADQQKNFVFSPIGYTTILGILSEGARNEMYNDIQKYLRYPDDRNLVQECYKESLKYLNGDNPLLGPQFKTWLYVYKNNTVEDTFKSSITDNYYVDVKFIERDYENVDESSDSIEVDFDHSDKPDPSAAKQPTIIIANDPNPLVPDTANNSKDIPDFETLKKTEPQAEVTKLSDDQKDSSKFDEVVEDQQYVEVPVIISEIKNENPIPNDTENLISEDKVKENLVDNTDGNAVESDSIKNIVERTSPEKIMIPLKKLEDLEIMQAEETQFASRHFASHNNGDVASVISGNSIVGERKRSRENNNDNLETKMLLFNGLYYRGNWQIPFQQLRAGPESVFYMSDTEEMPAKIMRSHGLYKTATLEKIKAQAIEFPYNNERYSFLIILPDSRTGLPELISHMTTDCLSKITSQLEMEMVDVSIPKFTIETTSGIEKILARTGLASLFTSKADFSGITRDQHLHIEELQQHVTFSIDEGSSRENAITATGVHERSNTSEPDKLLIIDRPFLFMVRDVIDDVVIVAGKITSPLAPDDLIN